MVQPCRSRDAGGTRNAPPAENGDDASTACFDATRRGSASGPDLTAYTVTYGLGGLTFTAQEGTRLLDAILANVPDHPHVCGGNGFCTSCRVEVEGLLSTPSRLEHERLGPRCGPIRLACQSHITGDVTVKPIVTASLIDWE